MENNHTFVYTIDMESNKKLWFKRKTYGWGWTPCTWQGWVAVFIYVLCIALFVSWLTPTDTIKQVIVKFILPLSIITLAFIELAYKKGETPKWQWGNKKESK